VEKIEAPAIVAVIERAQKERRDAMSMRWESSPFAVVYNVIVFTNEAELGSLSDGDRGREWMLKCCCFQQQREKDEHFWIHGALRC